MRILFRPRAPLAPIFGICRACPAPVRHAQAAAGPRARISVVLALGLILFASISGRAAAGVREQLDELITLAQGKRLGFITNPSGCDEVGGLDCVRPRMGAVRVSSLMIVQNRGERQGESELKIHCIRDPREESD